MSTRQRTEGTAPRMDTDSLSARITQAVMALVLTVVSVLMLVTTHRFEFELLGVEIPAGLLFGALFQVVTCVFLWSATGSRMPVLVLGCLWGLLAMPFLGQSAGGGVLMPAMLGEVPQYSGWIVQGLGVGIPFLFAGAVTLAARRPRRAR